MNRTWKDAACEVAWNDCQKQLPIVGEEDFRFYHMLAIVGSGRTFFDRFPPFRQRVPFVNDFNLFKQIMMKWLDENAPKQQDPTDFMRRC